MVEIVKERRQYQQTVNELEQSNRGSVSHTLHFINNYSMLFDKIMILTHSVFLLLHLFVVCSDLWGFSISLFRNL